MAGPASTSAAIRPARRADAGAIAVVHAQAWRESYGGILGPAAWDAGAEGRRLRQWRRILARPRQGGGTLVATLTGETVGFGAYGPQREDDRLADGEIYALYLLGRAQGLGLGRRLVAAMLARMRGWGATSADVWALERNEKACAFYAALGARPEARRIFSMQGRRVAERVFVWDDIDRLADLAER
ncbi:GNAT family N-acetyltransferase [Rubrimonas cliftonensis]|uniref:Ribosomal protein S18 acetylase RimI n=1 Tax=Rubrimonas cliftonensis TaxID=89524 RepID=A0A1H3VQB9_9RHOB|nr:GNAT family N-acetyltransferase [Rubrimonas cliftonensis]SDZ76288.1 Ribosomal protein S18 acetylase RimI [Rubrimonas cliftonensis]